MERVRAEERIFNLVLALLATPGGLTKQQIMQSVHGYVDSSRSVEARDRMFERDKGELRALGIPIEVIDDWLTPDTNQLQRYRIPKDAYEVPAEFDFDEREIRLIALASEIWRQGSLARNATGALTKLRSLGVPLTSDAVGVSPRVAIAEMALGPLVDAIQNGSDVKFDYLHPEQLTPLRRTVSPIVVFPHHDRLHLYAWEPARDGYRTFLLTRIVGEVISVPARGRRPTPEHPIETAVAELDELWRSNTAVISVQPGTEAEVRLRRRAEAVDADALVIHYTDRALFADELTSYANEVLVREPAELRDAVIARLRTVAADHRGRGDA